MLEKVAVWRLEMKKIEAETGRRGRKSSAKRGREGRERSTPRARLCLITGCFISSLSAISDTTIVSRLSYSFHLIFLSPKINNILLDQIQIGRFFLLISLQFEISDMERYGNLYSFLALIAISVASWYPIFRHTYCYIL